MVSKFTHSMESIGNNTLFNASGLATIFSFLALKVANLFSAANVDITLTISAGTIGVIWMMMRVYLTYLETKRLKKKIKEEEDADNKGNSGKGTKGRD